jgi:serine/tyrosine/threonine adenylyltransferase
MKNLHAQTYQNEFVNFFQGDKTGEVTPRQTPDAFYSLVKPTPVKEPRLIAWSEALADELALYYPDQKDIEILAGNRIVPGMQPYAACYGGHQFGHWAGQLGDGRAITLGELVTPLGDKWELQLKGAGLTPYSRRADGRAVLRSSVREYLMSEAMHYLGVPTTRALSLVSTGELVLRDMFYNGNPAYEPGAIVMRVSPSFLRFGNFEIFTSRKETDNLQKLVHWTIDRYFPHIQGEDKIIRWFREVVDRTAHLVVEWSRVGFVHGVMNTDNMSILGLTIDYGPYSFVDNFDLDFTPNTTDLPGRRYAFGKQASIAYWNLGCLAGALVPLFKEVKLLQDALDAFQEIYWQKFYVMMGKKLGFSKVSQQDTKLIHEFEQTLHALQPDMTIFYQLLIDLPMDLQSQKEVADYFLPSFYEEPESGEVERLFALIQTYNSRIKQNDISPNAAKGLMRANNPRFVLRNYLLHQVIEGLEKGSADLFNELEKAIQDPYAQNHKKFFQKRPDWATSKAGCSMLSCSS